MKELELEIKIKGKSYWLTYSDWEERQNWLNNRSSLNMDKEFEKKCNERGLYPIDSFKEKDLLERMNEYQRVYEIIVDKMRVLLEEYRIKINRELDGD